MRGTSSAASRSSLPGSKRGCSADSFTEMLGRPYSASECMVLKRAGRLADGVDRAHVALEVAVGVASAMRAASPSMS